MKQLSIILLNVFWIVNLSAQTYGDSSAYIKGLRIIESAITVADFKNAENYFETLSAEKPNEWLAPLYAGLCYVLCSFNESEGTLKDEYCDKAQILIDRAKSLNPDKSELASVQAFLYQARIPVNPLERGYEYSHKAEAEIELAESANSDDPRAYFLSAMNTYYTPEIFGGGAKKALPMFEDAANRFDNFVPKMTFMPHWGKQQNLDMIIKCKKELGIH